MKKTLAVLIALAAFVSSAQGLPLRRSRVGQRNNRPPRQESAPAPAPAAASATGGETGTASSSELNFEGASVDMVLKIYGEWVGKTVLKDPQVPQATITLKSDAGQTLTPAERIEAVEVVLEMNGVHLEPYGEKFVRALPRKDARKEGIPLYKSASALEQDVQDGKIPEGKVVSLMIKFDNIATEEAQKALEGFKSNNGILLVFERTNSILATDTYQNVQRMLEIAQAIDIASPVTEVVEYVQVEYASATEVKQVLDAIVQESQKEQEKNGKAPVNQGQPPPVRAPFAGGLLRRNGQPAAPTAPVNNASLVMAVSDADRGMIRGKVVTIADERSNKILLITNASNMKFFKEVIKALDVETTPDTVVKVYRLKYAEAEDVSDMINDLIGNSAGSHSSGKANQNMNASKGTSGSVTRNTQTTAKKPANQRSGEAKAGELTKDNTTVLADKRINGIVVMTQKELVPTLEKIITSMDVKLSQVLIETAIIEVSLNDQLSSGVSWTRTGRYRKTGYYQAENELGQKLYWNDNGDGKQVATTTPSDNPVIEFGERLIKGQFVNGNDAFGSMLGGGGSGDAPSTLGNMLSTAAAAATGGGESGESGGGTAAPGLWNGVTPIGSGLNWYFKSDALNIAAVVKAAKTDGHTKMLASPVVMTLDNKEATINATEMSYLLKGFTSSGNSYSTIAVPDYEQKELGIEIKVTPKINPNGTVMLTVEAKYTQQNGSQTIKYTSGGSNTSDSKLMDVDVPLTATREMNSDVLLENMQTVVFGGLTKTFKSQSETGIPFLKDIPLIGRWLFGSVEERETRNELLIFMTPYVLDDGEALQAEALRRKRALSDSRPWEDNGWSLSPLADPVSKKEQMRRIKEEWKKQDEERRTRIAIEKQKVDRVKALEKLSEAERKLWLEMHKEELDDAERDKLEDKMLDAKSQDELKKIAANYRQRRLAAAEKTLKEEEKAQAAQNERGRLEAEKKAAQEEAARELGEGKQAEAARQAAAAGESAVEAAEKSLKDQEAEPVVGGAERKD